MRRKIIIGNWSMASDMDHCEGFLPVIIKAWHGVHRAEVCLCPAYPYLDKVARALEHSNIVLGAQDIDVTASSSLTGGVNARMLADVGCHYVIIGHSEGRRQYQLGYSDIAEKHMSARKNGLIPILCVGETLSQFKQRKTFDVIGRQLLKVVSLCGLGDLAKGVITYQPDWANAGQASTNLEFVQEVHSYIREIMGPEGDQVRIIYGGEVLDADVQDLLNKKDVDGLLVGEPSLDVNRFIQVCRAAE